MTHTDQEFRAVLDHLAEIADAKRDGHVVRLTDSAGKLLAIGHLPRCWSCIVGQCVGGPHPWADLDDIEAVAPDLAERLAAQSCGCECVEKPEMAFVQDPDEMVDVPQEEVSLFVNPCQRCGAIGACGYDAEGLPMIHTQDASE